MSPQESDIHSAQIPDDELLKRIRQGDQAAEQMLFDRYYARLVNYARCRMYPKLQRAEPPSSIAQSAMKSVFLGIPVHQFNLAEGESLWPLLVTITLNKISKRSKYYFACRRDIRRNQAMEDYTWLLPGKDAESQSELNDLVDQLLNCFSGRRRAIIERLLEDRGTGEIARELGISEKTVYRTRLQAIDSLTELLQSQDEEQAES